MNAMAVIATHGLMDTEVCEVPLNVSLISAVPCLMANYSFEKVNVAMGALYRDCIQYDRDVAALRTELLSLARRGSRASCVDRRFMDRELCDVEDHMYQCGRATQFMVRNLRKGDRCMDKHLCAFKDEVSSKSIDNRVTLFADGAVCDIMPSWVSTFRNTCSPSQTACMNHRHITWFRMHDVLQALADRDLNDVVILDLSCSEAGRAKDPLLQRRICREIRSLWSETAP
jgi:hypothetical protein